MKAMVIPMKKRNIFLREMENRRLGWGILLGVTALFFLLCRIPLFWPPETENGSILMGTLLFLLCYLYAIFHGFFAYQMTEKILLPCLTLALFSAVFSISDPSGILLSTHKAESTGYLAADFLYLFWKSLKFSAVSGVIGIYTKNVR